MFRNSLMANKEESPSPQQTPVVKPGDYELGSPESRAAARAMLDSRFANSSPKRARVRKFETGPSTRPPTCQRSRWPDGTICDIVFLGRLSDAVDKSRLSEATLDRLISKIPVDDKQYPLGEPDELK